MKTSYSRAWECEPPTYVFLIFRLKNNMDTILQVHKSYTQSLESNILSKVQAPLQQVRHQMRVWGNREEGMME